MNNLMTKYRLARGFSLIELMIALAVVALLVGIAFPSYKNYILRSHRPDAIAALAQDQAILERCYAQNFAYNTACASLPAFPHNSSQSYYSIALTNLSATTYTLVASAIGKQTADTNCTSIRVDQANQKTASDSSGTSQASCWSM